MLERKILGCIYDDEPPPIPLQLGYVRLDRLGYVRLDRLGYASEKWREIGGGGSSS